MAIAVHKRLLLYMLLAVVLWWPVLRAFLRLAISDENYTYTLLVLGVAVLLLCLKRWPSPQNRPLLPLLILMTASTILAVGIRLRAGLEPASQPPLSAYVLLFLGSLIAALVQIYTRAGFRQLQFPVLFSLLAVPPPREVISRLITALQWGSAGSAALLFTVFRVPFLRDGLEFSFSNVDIVVAQECSSIRSSTILVITTVVLSHIFLKFSWSRWVAILISIPMAVFKNGVRIFTLSVLAQYVNPNWLDSPLHHRGGFIFLGFGIVLMLGVMWMLAKIERRSSSSCNPGC